MGVLAHPTPDNVQPDGQHDQSVDLLQEWVLHVRRALRGRIGLVIPLSIVLGVVFGVAGFMLAAPKYTSTGLVRVAPTLPKLLYENEQNQLPPSYASLVAVQATLLSREDFLESALSNMPSQLSMPGDMPDTITALMNTVDIHHRRGEEVISVKVTSRSPGQARAAVNAVLDLYLLQQYSASNTSRGTTEQRLVSRVEELRSSSNELQEQIFQIAGPYGGSEMLERLYQTRMRELEVVDKQLIAMGVKISSLNSEELFDGTSRSKDWASSGVLSPSKIMLPGIAESVILARLEADKRALDIEIETLAEKFAPTHRAMRQLASQLRAVNQAIKEYHTHSNARGEDVVQAVSAHLSQHNVLGAEARRLGRTRLQLASLQEQLKLRRERLVETSRRLEELRVESDPLGATRISIAARGDLPSHPSQDRHVLTTTAGTILGLICGLGIIAFIGLMDKRCRYIEDADALAQDIPLLGAIPELKPSDSWRQDQAAFGVHQIRNMLQFQSPVDGSQVYCLTSPGPSEGKTSIAMALAVSFSVSGHKTLLIDADVHRYGTTRDLGLSGSNGLREAVGAGDLESCVAGDVESSIHAGPINNLSVMPIGNTSGFLPAYLSRSALERLINSLRERFATIIIDTTPLLGGIEALSTSAVADKVVLTVGRNSDSRLILASLRRLNNIGAECSGLVFNRASVKDYERSDTCNRYIAYTADSDEASRVSGSPIDLEAFGVSRSDSASSKRTAVRAA